MSVVARLSLLVPPLLIFGCANSGVPAFPGETPDPLEPVNRRIWAANETLLHNVVQPVGKSYRAAVPEPVRQSIRNVGRNASSPGRLLNEMLQGRWSDLSSETARFLTNSTIGLAGLRDPATSFGIAMPRADFNQTFRSWGASPSTYLILPGLGPSDNIAFPSYLADHAVEPWWYFDSPYDKGWVGVTAAELADESEVMAELLKTEPDAYQSVRLFVAYANRAGQPDWSLNGPVHDPTFETLAAASAAPDDPRFGEKSREFAVKLSTTGKRLPFNLWLQNKPAPLVYIVPGLRSHRLSGQVLGQAEKLYREGYSVVTITASFHPEFMKLALTAPLPGEAASTSQDLVVVLKSIDDLLSKRFTDQITERSLMGFSMGAFQTLRLAAMEEESGLRFDHYLAINPPVDLITAARSLDAFALAPLEWPAEERAARIENTLHKTVLLARNPKKAVTAPYEGAESKLLVGLFFKSTLRTVIFESQLRENFGILKAPLNKWHREPAYREIDQFTFLDYYNQFVTPYHLAQGKSRAEMEQAKSLRFLSQKLRGNSRVRVIHSANDFLLSPADHRWLKSTFRSRLIMFPRGGHLGSLLTEPVQKAVLKSL